jgi:hypothetical protein
MTDNVKQLPGAVLMVDKMKLLKDMRDEMAFHLEYAAITAEIVRKRYLVLVANGFTEEQALQLCSKPLS